jgi:predicted small integral membrane protein
LQLNLLDHQGVEIDLVVLEDGEIQVLLSEFNLSGSILKLFRRSVEQIEVDVERETHFGETPVARPRDRTLQRSTKTEIMANAIDATLDDRSGSQEQVRRSWIEFPWAIEMLKDQPIRRKSDQRQDHRVSCSVAHSSATLASSTVITAWQITVFVDTTAALLAKFVIIDGLEGLSTSRRGAWSWREVSLTRGNRIVLGVVGRNRVHSAFWQSRVGCQAVVYSES